MVYLIVERLAVCVYDSSGMILIFIFISGLAIGSFISASVWRFHELEIRNKKQEDGKNKKDSKNTSSNLGAQTSDLSIATGRSMCEHCGHTLAPKDLIPLLSWLSLSGKCRYCSAKLSWEYPVVELTTGALFILSYLAWDFSEIFGHISFGLWLVFLSALVFLALYDLKWLILPNKVVYPLIISATALVLLESVFFDGGIEIIKDSLFGLLFAGGIFYALFAVSKGKWIGGGDVKLGIFIGIFLGFSRSVLTFVLAFNIAALVILPLLLLGIVKRKSPIPFGPFLILATVVSALYGYSIIEWYSNNFLYGLI